MAINYYVDLSLGTSGGTGSSSSPWNATEFQTQFNSNVPVAAGQLEVYNLKGSYDSHRTYCWFPTGTRPRLHQVILLRLTQIPSHLAGRRTPCLTCAVSPCIRIRYAHLSTAMATVFPQGCGPERRAN